MTSGARIVALLLDSWVRSNLPPTPPTREGREMVARLEEQYRERSGDHGPARAYPEATRLWEQLTARWEAG